MNQIQPADGTAFSLVDHFGRWIPFQITCFCISALKGHLLFVDVVEIRCVQYT